MKLILVRHGETLWNKERRFQGVSDIELSENGLKQAEKLGVALKSETIEAIYTSPLKRAFQTALKIGVYHNAPLSVKAELQELNQGDFEGLTINVLTENHGDFLKKWLLNPASCIMPNGESLTMLQDRAWPVIKRIIKSNRNTLVVAHNFTLMTIICKFLNLSLSDFRKVHIDTASITIVTIDRGDPIVSLLNDTSHLADD
ncbi:MAG: histidine phosphatase family protein [Deltaproteobacteria bacterium]|nr:histidine phosphatase family protein [Deltaproteobacteria bacterium]